MTSNIIGATHSIKSGFTGFQPPLTTFLNDPNYTANEQKVILSHLSDRGGQEPMIYADDKPFAYELMEKTGVDKVEVISLTDDNNKFVENLTIPPKKDDTKEMLINGAIVVIGVIVLVKLLS
jgi:hypothetical protein